MSLSDAERERKVPRRRFLKWTGALAVAGAAGIGLGYAANLVGKSNENSVSTKLAPITSTSSTSTTAEPSTPTAVTTVTVTTTQPSVASTTATSADSALATQVPANTFSIFWMTDTQFLSESNPALYRMTTKWIVDNWSAYNGKLVIHTGDLVEDGDVQAEWQNANEAMSVLSKNNVPYSWCAGNHDDLVGGETESGWMGNIWASAFDPSTMKPKVNALGYTSWAGDFHEGMNTAVTFTANGWNFLVINVEFNGDSTVVDWVESLIDDPLYADYKVIIAPHAYMDAYGDIDDPRWGPTLSDFVTGLTAVMDAHSSDVFLTLNGHFATDQGYNTVIPVNNRNQLMFDRQDCTDDPSCPSGRGVDVSDSTTLDSDKVGGSTLMILTFDTANNQISAKTYDVYTGKWRVNAFEQYTFPMFFGQQAAPVHSIPVPPVTLP